VNSSITLNNATIKTSLGNNAMAALPAVNTSGILVDAVPLLLVMLQLPPGKAYKSGDTLGLF